MCTSVNLMREERAADTIGDLIREGFVVQRSDMPNGYEWQSDECLCNVNVRAILERSGRPHEYDAAWGEWKVGR